MNELLGPPKGWTTPASINSNVWWHITHNHQPVVVVGEKSEPLAVLMPWNTYEELMNNQRETEQ